MGAGPSPTPTAHRCPPRSSGGGGGPGQPASLGLHKIKQPGKEAHASLGPAGWTRGSPQRCHAGFSLASGHEPFDFWQNVGSVSHEKMPWWLAGHVCVAEGGSRTPTAAHREDAAPQTCSDLDSGGTGKTASILLPAKAGVPPPSHRGAGGSEWSSEEPEERPPQALSSARESIREKKDK